jgi:hypothetical protein
VVLNLDQRHNRNVDRIQVRPLSRNAVVNPAPRLSHNEHRSLDRRPSRNADRNLDLPPSRNVDLNQVQRRSRSEDHNLDLPLSHQDVVAAEIQVEVEEIVREKRNVPDK